MMKQRPCNNLISYVGMRISSLRPKCIEGGCVLKWHQLALYHHLKLQEKAQEWVGRPLLGRKFSHTLLREKFPLTPMETVLMIPRELEHFESLVKLAKRKKDAEAINDQVSMVSATLAIRQICINKTHRSKTLHLPVEINSYVVEGLVDTGASMSVMVAAVVRELGMMHLVIGSETYKIASGVVTQALG